VCVGERVCVAFVMTEVFLNLCVVFLIDGCILNLTEFFHTLIEVFPCFFLSCKANARVKLAFLDGARPALFNFFLCSMYFYLCCTMYCLCVILYCHRATTQLHLIRIIIIFFSETSETTHSTTRLHIAEHLNSRTPSDLSLIISDL
jgi:hypothetical protein